jgi:hypothetical protein
LVAYVYALMRGERSGATAAARDLLAREPGAAISCAGYLHGLAAARQVLGEQHRQAGSHADSNEISETLTNVRSVLN